MGRKLEKRDVNNSVKAKPISNILISRQEKVNGKVKSLDGAVMQFNSSYQILKWKSIKVKS